MREEKGFCVTSGRNHLINSRGWVEEKIRGVRFTVKESIGSIHKSDDHQYEETVFMDLRLSQSINNLLGISVELITRYK